MYKIKYTSNGEIERLKGQLVVHGNRQVACIDYNETFAPVAKMAIVRVLFAISAAWQLHRIDVHNAFYAW